MVKAEWISMGLLAAAILIGSIGAAIAYRNGPPAMIGGFMIVPSAVLSFRQGGDSLVRRIAPGAATRRAGGRAAKGHGPCPFALSSEQRAQVCRISVPRTLRHSRMKAARPVQPFAETMVPSTKASFGSTSI